MRRKGKDEQVGSDSGLILVAKSLVHVLVHERSLSDSGFETSVSSEAQGGGGEVNRPTVAQNNNLMECG